MVVPSFVRRRALNGPEIAGKVTVHGVPGGLLVVGRDRVNDLTVGFDGFFINSGVIQCPEQLDGVRHHRKELRHHPVSRTAGNADMKGFVLGEMVFPGVNQRLDFPAQGSSVRRMSSSSRARRTWSGI